jgi:hypothetical protein
MCSLIDCVAELDLAVKYLVRSLYQQWRSHQSVENVMLGLPCIDGAEYQLLIPGFLHSLNASCPIA